jgi:hypothetical protein
VDGESGRGGQWRERMSNPGVEVAAGVLGSCCCVASGAEEGSHICPGGRCGWRGMSRDGECQRGGDVGAGQGRADLGGPHREIWG